jgi:dihydroorotate dehydrogenase
MYSLVRPLLYSLPAETAHRLVMAGMRAACSAPPVLQALRAHYTLDEPILRVDALGMTFPNPIGLAAGMDKDAEAFEAFGAIGFAFVEVGTLTAQAQPGNERPRLFRLVRDRALINRMGFNNQGARAAAERIASTRERRAILGINIGKSKVVPNELALDDYAQSARLLAPHADYLVVNVSSPNTPGLRDLQAVSVLRPLLERVRRELDAARAERRVPLLLKIAPDLADADIDAIADLALALSLDGIIATNTTIRREGLVTEADTVGTYGAGGLSGPPLKARALEVLRRLRVRLGDRIVLVAAGGIETADDAWERIRSGASLVQLYTSLVYEGPELPRRIAEGLAARVREAGLPSIAHAIGADIDRTHARA